MWNRVVSHLEESRIYKRPNQPYLEIKHQRETFQTRFLIFHPFRLKFVTDYNRKGFSDIINHPFFCPNSPFHLEIDTNKSFSLSMNFQFPKNLKYIGKYINEKIRTNIAFTTTEVSPIMTLFNFIYNDKFGLSFSINPQNYSFRYDSIHHGFEIIYSVEEQQPSLGYRYNRCLKQTEITTLATIYGNVGTLLTTYYKKARFSTFFEVNAWTLTSDVAFGIATPIFSGNSNLSASYKYSTNSFNLELSLNQFENDSKSGFTAYLPLSLSFLNLSKKP